MDRYVHMAICPTCDKPQHVLIGPAHTQHTCEGCGGALDFTFTESVLLRDPSTERR